MIVGFSTSSRWASVALISTEGGVLWSAREEAPQAASGACLRLLESGLSALGVRMSDAELFLADLGPGSFTGVRVGVTLAKTLAYVHGTEAGGCDAFDLIDPAETVVVPNKRGEWFVRRPGEPASVVDVLPVGPFVGYGSGFVEQTYPDASRFSALISQIKTAPPEALVPAYLVEPSISTPKNPYGAGVAG